MTEKPLSKGHVWSRRIYRPLLLLYPAGFRREFGPELLILFDDICRDALLIAGCAAVFGIFCLYLVLENLT